MPDQNRTSVSHQESLLVLTRRALESLIGESDPVVLRGMVGELELAQAVTQDSDLDAGIAAMKFLISTKDEFDKASAPVMRSFFFSGFLEETGSRFSGCAQSEQLGVKLLCVIQEHVAEKMYDGAYKPDEFFISSLSYLGDLS